VFGFERGSDLKCSDLKEVDFKVIRSVIEKHFLAIIQPRWQPEAGQIRPSMTYSLQGNSGRKSVRRQRGKSTTSYSQWKRG